MEHNKILVLKYLLEKKSWQFQTLNVVTRTDVARIFNSLLDSWVDSKYSLGSSGFILNNDYLFAINIKRLCPHVVLLK